MNSLVTWLEGLHGNHRNGITFIRSGAAEDFLSYHDLYHGSCRVLHNLVSLGCAPGTEVIFLVDDPRKFLLAFWACLQGRIIPVPLAPGKQSEHLRKISTVWQKLEQPFILTDLEDKAAFEQFFADDPALAGGAVSKAIFFSSVEGDNGTAHAFSCGEQDLAFIQYSSGSTSQPKGVMLTHANLVANASDIIKSSGTTAADSALCWMPLTHDMGLIGFHITCLLAGIDQYIIPTSLFVKRPQLWIEKASSNKVTQLYSPNFGYHYFLSSFDAAAASLDLSSVRIIYNGAEPISVKVCNAFLQALAPFGLKQDSMLAVYGLAEASVAATIPPAGEGFRSFYLDRRFLDRGVRVRVCDAADEHASCFTGVGRPLSHCAVRISDETGNSLPDNTIGQIQIKGKNVTAGYYKDAEQTAKAFTHDGWLRTGDLGFMQQGSLVITGREKNMLIVHGQNYYYHDIENLLVTATGLEFGRIAACGLRSGADEALGVFVVHKAGASQFASIALQVRAAVMQRLGIPVSHIIPVKRIPRTTSGKTQYFKLAQQFSEGGFNHAIKQVEQLMQESAGPQAEGQCNQQLMKCFQEVLGMPVGWDDNIWQLGLNSIHAIKLCAAINRQFNCAITVADLFVCTSAKAMADHISKLPASGGTPLPANASDTGMYPASPCQKRFYVLSGDPLYSKALVIRWSYRIEGSIDTAALQFAFQQLVNRHRALRTRLAIIDEEVMQVVTRPGEALFNIAVHDLSATANKEAAFTALLNAEADTELNPSTRLFKATLITLSEESHALLLSAHHTILDGWSLAVIAKDISLFYQSYQAEAENFPAPANLQFTNFALHADGTQDALNYWLEELDGDIPQLNLPFNSPGGATQQASGMVELHLEKELTEKLLSIAKAHETTTFNVLAAVLNLLLHKYTGAQDIVTGTNFSGRWTAGAFEQVGLFTNTLPIRCKLSRSSRFTDLLDHLKNKLGQAFKHDVPFEHILEKLSANGRLKDNALFNVLFIHQDYADNMRLALGEAISTLAHFDELHQPGFVDLQFESIATGHSLSLRLTYRVSVAGKDTAGRLLQHFAYLLQQVVESPSKNIAAYRLLNDAEEKIMLTRGNATYRENHHNTVTVMFSQAAARFGSLEAVVCGNSRLDYRQVDKLSDHMAHYLVARYHAGRDKRVGLMMQRSEKSIIALLAVLKSGAAFVPIDVEWPAERKAFIVKDAGLDLVICDEADDHLPFTAMVPYEGLANVIGLMPALHETAQPALTDAAYVMYTSGTTGLPKGVVVTHGSLADYVQTFTEHFNIQAGDRVIHQSSLSFDVAIEEIFPVLCAGGALVVFAPGGMHVDELAAVVQKENISVLSTTPAIISHLDELAPALTSLKALISGGESLKPEHIRRLQGLVPVYNTYGPTESTVCATYHKVQAGEHVLPIGKPIANRTVYILNGHFEVLPAGITGEIFIGGKGLAKGYLHQPGLTKEKFVADPFHEGQIIYRTGDLGYWNAQGEIVFAGRKDSQVKLLGYRIEPGEIEHCLLQHEAVDRAVVLVHEFGQGQKQLVAFYCTRRQHEQFNLAAYLLQKLPRQMIPARFVQVAAIPVNSSGKTDVNALLATLHEQEIEDAQPLNKTEKQVAELWQQVLKTNDIPANANFFELGGQSIKGIQLVSRVNRVFNTTIDIGYLYQFPVLREFASRLSTAPPAMLQPIAQAPEQPHYELSMAQKGLWLLHQIEGGSAPFHIFGVYELKGALNIAALQQSFNAVVKRHNSLQTFFIQLNGEPRQVVDKSLQLQIPVYDLQKEPGAEARIQNIIENEWATEFDLSKAPLMRACLVQKDAGHFLLVLTLHHLVADGWSALVLADEVFAFYRAAAGYSTDVPEELNVQYKEYVHRQQQLLGSPLLEQNRSFWKHYLEGAHKVKLPFDYKHSGAKRYEGATMDFFIPASHALAMEEMCRMHNATFFTLLLAMLNVLLYRLSSSHDIIIGSPFSGRTDADLEKQVGLFVNPLVFRTKINEDDSFIELLAQVKENSTRVLQHKDFPFELLAGDQRSGWEQDGNGLFNVRFLWDEGDIQMNNFDRHIAITDALTMRQVEYYPPTSIHDISFIFSKQEKLKVSLQYSTSLFAEETIELIKYRLLKLVATVIEKPGARLKHLDLRVETEIQQDALLASLLNANEAF